MGPGRTRGRVVVWHAHVAVQRDTNHASLVRLVLLAVDLDSVCMREDQVVADAASESACVTRHPATDTNIQGSVELSPSVDLERSDERPGANAPLP
jgi:hypothetical protein